MPTPTINVPEPVVTASLAEDVENAGDEEASETETVNAGSPNKGLLSPRGPFNFQPTTYAPGISPRNGDVGRRRGHKYARSSVSHEIMLSPAPTSPLLLPVSLPTPTLKEFAASMTAVQRKRLMWALCHLVMALILQPSAHGSLTTAALSHLLLFDAMAAGFSVLVDIGRNFEAFSDGTIRSPYGMVRTEVLVGMGLSITLFIYGLDLLSHSLMGFLEQILGHEPHHVHPPGEKEFAHVKVGGLNLVVLAATMISATVLDNRAGLGRLLQLPSLVPGTVRNQSHMLPLSLSFILLVLPFLGIQIGPHLDRILAFIYAATMTGLGGQQCYTNGRIILNSLPVDAVNGLIRELERDPDIVQIDDVKVFQLHYALGVANFKFRVRDMDHAEPLRDRVEALVRNRLGEGYRPGVEWQTTIQITLGSNRARVTRNPDKSDKPRKSAQPVKDRRTKGSRT